MSNGPVQIRRKSFDAESMLVTPLNLEEVAKWCNGVIMDDGEKEGNLTRNYIKVQVSHPANLRQTEAHVGDYVVKMKRNFKVYREGQYRATFELRSGQSIAGGSTYQGKNKSKPKHTGPNPGNMPKKRTEGPREEGVPEIGDKMTGQSHAGITSTPASVAPEIRGDNRPQLGDDELRRFGLPTSIDEGYEPVYRDTLGPNEIEFLASGKTAINIPIDDLSNQLTDMTLAGASAEEINAKVQESIGVMDEMKLAEGYKEIVVDSEVGPVEVIVPVDESEAQVAVPLTSEEYNAAVEEPAPKPITLDELNSMAGDPRSAQEIMADNAEMRTPGEIYRGEA